MSTTLWHYTDTNGLIGMLTKHVIWATSVSFMNDPEETRYAADIMREATEDLPGLARGSSRGFVENALLRGPEYGYSDRFVACASRAKDSLELWRGYGAASVQGTFAVGLDPDVPLGVLAPDEYKHSHGTLNGPHGWSQVNYEPRAASISRINDDLRRDIQALRTEFASGRDRDAEDIKLGAWNAIEAKWSQLVSSSKHEAYRAESEFRLTCHVASSDLVHLRSSANGPVPYVQLARTETWGETASGGNILPVTEVIAWPGAPLAALNGVAAALHKGGHAHSREDPLYRVAEGPIVKISTSTVPFV